MNHHCRSDQVWHVFSRDLTVLPAHPHVHLQSEWAIPAFAFPAIAGTHLPTPDGWKAELAWVAGYVVRQFTCPKAVTHPNTNRAQVEQQCWLRLTRYHHWGFTHFFPTLKQQTPSLTLKTAFGWSNCSSSPTNLSTSEFLDSILCSLHL